MGIQFGGLWSRAFFSVVVAIVFAVQVLDMHDSHARIRVAVTVDDLPMHAPIPPGESRIEIAQKIIASLKRHNVPEVYGFINAGKIKEDPLSEEVLSLWIQAGYPLGNHVYDHLSLNDLTVQKYIGLIEENVSFLVKYNGGMDWKYFRYPFLHEGETLEKRNAVRTYLANQNYRISHVTIDTRDWAWNEAFSRCGAKGVDVETLSWMKTSFVKYSVDNLVFADKLSSALFGRQIPHILLLHIGVFDAIQVDALLTQYENEGVEFIPLSEALKDPIYSLDPALASANGSEFTFQIMNSRGLSLVDLGIEPIEHFPWEKLRNICQAQK